MEHLHNTQNKAELVDNIHTMQNLLASSYITTYTRDWVIGLLSRIAQDVANLELDNTTDQKIAN